MSRDELIFLIYCQKPGWSEEYVNGLSDEEMKRILEEGEKTNE